MKIGESSFILLVELRNGSRINKELKFLFAWALYHMKGCLETWYHDVKPTRSFPLNSRKLLRTCDWPESFGSSSGRWTKIQSFLKSLLILNPWQASQSIPIEVVYEKEGFLYKKEGVSIVMRKGTTASSVWVLRCSLVWKGLARDISGTQNCTNIKSHVFTLVSSTILANPCHR